jgi:hypothetical protein
MKRWPIGFFGALLILTDFFMANEIAPEIKVPIRFKKRPYAVAPDFRPGWKVSLLLLILHLSSRGGRSSLTRLHVLNWAARSVRHQREFAATLKAEAPLFSFKVRFEPAFSRAVDLAAAAGLVSWVGGNRIEVSATGSRIAKKLERSVQTFRPEISFLQGIGKSVTESQALALAKGADIV